ncbi:hypothetical protein NX801_28380 [Streptomyces sp. LP05-1]|uniref:vWA-MoxR associated protein middle region 2 domain-containing protein n=1 Tax=Streptomyces pyxinae TaxID=2970734 RepID=A0ABT2CQV7_9ACTN|nr:hypothetical protein [Streptomyces sp. LP05-1]MCS0639482.1 hypothetical protein [Streptomyces sp. LP05-1]
MSGARHVLVIGAQCPALGLLDELEQAARALHDALTAPWVGACEKDRVSGATLLCGAGITQSEVERAVREAGRQAASAGALLVVALLGHGMAAGGRLYFMAGDSEEETPLSAVDVKALLGQVLDTAGVDGLIALVDTCHAAGAVPDLGALATGIRRGEVRLSLLMGAGADQEAYGLRFSRTVTRVLQHGIAGAGETLSPAAVAEAVRADGGAPGQSIVQLGFDGAQWPAARLWLARNVRHAFPAPGSLLGEIGREELARALAPLDDHAVPVPAGGPEGFPDTSAVPGLPGAGLPDAAVFPEAGGRAGAGAGGAPAAGTTWAELARAVTTPGDLAALRAPLAALPPPERDWARGVFDALDAAVRTADLLTAWPGTAALTSPMLLRALGAVRPASASAAPLPVSTGGELLRDAVEYVLLRAPRTGGRRLAPVAEFVAGLARETGVDPHEPRLRAWAAGIGAGIDLNDALARQREHHRDLRLRLILSLHAAVGDDWPESLAAWLLDEGTVRHREEFPCAQDRPGVEQGIGTALRWATRLASSLETPLRRVEIAAPAPLLVQWRPEETDFGMRLGAEHDVVLRWSDRIQPPDHLWWINDKARKALRAMDSSTDTVRADWLGEPDTRHVRELRDRLMNAPRSRALGLAHRPPQLRDLMETLLASSPIVLWTDEDLPVPDEVRGYLDAHWHLLPLEFCQVYRESWHRRTPDAGPLPSAECAGPPGRTRLAALRSVWDGHDWLDFCTWFEQEQL